MRVVLLDTADPFDVSGGQGVFVRNVVGCSRHDMVVAGTAGHDTPLGRMAVQTLGNRRIQTLAIAHHLGAGKRPLVPERLRCALGALRFLGRVPNADVFYVSSAELLPAALARRKGRPVVFQIHGAGNALAVSRYSWARWRPFVLVWGWLWRYFVRRVDLILSVDHDGCDAARDAGATAPCVLLPPMYDDSVFTCVRREVRSKGRLVYAGRLEAAKQVDLLVRAVSLLRSRGVEVSLELIGEGTERASLESLSRHLGISEWCSFRGWLSHVELAESLQNARLFVLASAQEGLTTAVIESLACGVPALTRPVGGLRTLIRPGHNGWLWRGDGPASLADAIDSALSESFDPHAVASTVRQYRRSQVVEELDGRLERAAMQHG